MKVMLTGSCGFIGSNFIIYALQHTMWDLVSIDKITSAGSLLNVPQVKRHRLCVGDVCDAHFIKKIFEIEKPDVVIHGVASNDDTFVNTNVVGTHSMLDACIKSHMPAKFINISSDEIYGSLASGSFAEDAALNPCSPVASSKAGADLLARSYFAAHGVPVVTARVSNNFGPRQKQDKLIPKAIMSVLTGKRIPVFGDGKQVRDWMYVKDTYHAIYKLINDGKPGETYNVGSGRELTNIDVLNKILEVMNADQEFIEFVEDKPIHDKRYAIDCSKLKSLGWTPEYDFESAILHTVGWYKANKAWFCK